MNSETNFFLNDHKIYSKLAVYYELWRAAL